MYLLTIEAGNKQITKKAKTEKELWRLVNVYYSGKQEEKKKLYQQLLNKKDNGTLQTELRYELA